MPGGGWGGDGVTPKPSPRVGDPAAGRAQGLEASGRRSGRVPSFVTVPRGCSPRVPRTWGHLVTLSQYCMALGVLGHPPPAARHPLPTPRSTLARGWGPSSPPFPCASLPVPPPPWSPSPGGDTPALSPSGEGRRGCPVVAAMVAPSVSQVVPVVGKRAPPPQSLPSTDQSPPVWSCCSRCQAPALSAFGEGEAPPGWGGWWVPPVPSLLAPCT